MPVLLAQSHIVGALTIDATGKITGCNAAFARMLGYPSTRELVGLNLRDELLIDGSRWDGWINADSEILPVDVAMRCANGEETLVRGDLRVRRDGSGQLEGLEGILVDVIERQRMDGVDGAARLQAIGALTSGIAHDFNNLLTVIVGNLYLLVEGVRDNDDLVRKAKSARDAAKRGADLTRQLLSFARRKSGVSKVIDVGATIGGVQTLLERALGPGIKLAHHVPEEIWPIRIDVAQLESALINLAVNARDAMQNGGSLVIKAGNMTLNENERAGPLDPGDYVTVSVIDDGPGIPAAIRERVFEPFFSTKTDRGGSGLGLSMVRRFAELSAGAVEIESEVGQGTMVTLFLPRVRHDTTDATLTLMTGTRPLCTLATGEEVVLVLSSDEHVRSTVQELLEVLGYTTTVVSTAQEVYETLKCTPVDLLISDAIPEPGVSVREFLSSAHRASANVKVILMSDRPTVNTAGLDRVDYDVMVKPFSLTDLADTVRQVLDRRT